MEEEQTIQENNEAKPLPTKKQKRVINRKPKKVELPNLGEFTSLMQSILIETDVTTQSIQEKIGSSGAAIVVDENYNIDFVAISLETYQELFNK